MNEYIVLAGPVTIPGGCLFQFTPKEFKRRRSGLRASGRAGFGADVYESLRPMDFRTGDTFCCDLDLTRLLGDRLARADTPTVGLATAHRHAVRHVKPPAAVPTAVVTVAPTPPPAVETVVVRRAWGKRGRKRGVNG